MRGIDFEQILRKRPNDFDVAGFRQIRQFLHRVFEIFLMV